MQSQFSQHNDIHPTVIIEGDVKIGKHNVIKPYTIIIGPVEIGDNNIIGPHVVIGSPGQDTRNPRYDSTDKFISIGNNNIIREFSAIQKPCYEDLTSLGNDIYVMQSVHIPHDAQVMDKVVITPMVVLAGLTRILEGANLAMGCSVNQYSVVGQYSIVAAGSAVMKNVKPFAKFIPGKPLGVNDYAIKKYGFEDAKDEIRGYVLEQKAPVDERIVSIVDEYNRFDAISGRPSY